MAATTASNSQSSIRIPRPSKERRQVFGYPLDSGWIIEFGRKHNVDPKGVKTWFGLVADSVELIRDELKKDDEYALVRFHSGTTPGVVAQIYVARNYLSPMSGSTTKVHLLSNVEKLKKFLDTNDEPRWMNT